MSSSQSSSSSASSFQGIENPDALRALLSYITQAAGGGTADYQAQRNKRNQALLALQQSMQDFSTDAASSDAAALMELNLQRSMEKAMPAISKGIQGAGTSAGSMQALMSNKIAQEAALSAGALGAEQQKAYGQILANMHGTAEEFTRIDTSNEQGLLKALDLMRIGRSQQQSSSSGASESGGGGGSRASSGGGGYSGGGYVGGGGYPIASGSSWAPSHFNPGPGDIGNLNDPYGSSSSGSSSGSDPFFYDDWGTGSDGYGGMASNPSAYNEYLPSGSWNTNVSQDWYNPNYSGQDYSSDYSSPYSGDSGGYW
jgi:hypothetical protein